MLNKDAISRALARNHGITIKKATAVYGDVLDVIAQALSEGDNVRLAGFGTLRVVEVEERTIQNPRSLQPMTIQATKRVKFKPAAGLKRRVNNQ